MNKYEHFDSLRGVACLIVLFSHIMLTYFPFVHNFDQLLVPETNYIQYFLFNSPFGFLYSGTFSVYLFFILSGSVIYCSAEKKNLAELSPYLLTRYLRLMIPVLGVTLICYLVFYIIDTFSLSLSSSWLRKNLVSSPDFLESIFQNCFNAFVFGKSNYNLVLWTMQIELIGSLMVYVYAITEKCISRLVAYILLTIFILVMYVLNSYLSLGLICFFIGIIYIKYPIKLSKLLMAFLFITAIYFSSAHQGSYSYRFFEPFLGGKMYTILNFIAASLFCLAFYNCDFIKLKFSKYWLVWLGKISFILYLVHIPMLFISDAIVSNYVLSITGDESYLVYISIILVLSLSIFFANGLTILDRYSISITKSINKKISCNLKSFKSKYEI
ncbi:acyltransferase [Vibrio fluvialis]|nr:acyltransferase [Vibrio fluvialis]